MDFQMTIENVQKMLDKKIFSCEELVKLVLNNISYLACATGAYITVCRESAINEAKRIDKEGRNYPLSGIPIAVKDNICTKDVMTTAGSQILKGFVPPYDATVVEKLKMQGAIIIGKTNMDEFGMGSTGENSAYKSTANPVDYTYVSGGSSSGSAVAVKSGQAIAALGSDTGGSIRQPASFCNLYGLKPTYSRVSRYGLIAFSSSLDTIGPICQSVKDCAVMLNAIAGADKRDMTSSKKEVPDYTKALSIGVKGIKIGVIKEFFENIDEDVKEAVKKAIDDYKYLGAELEECSAGSLKYALGAYYILSSAEASSNLQRYDGVRFGTRSKEYNSLEEMYVKSRSEGFGDEVKRRIMIGTFVLTGDYYNLYYRKALEAVKIIKAEFNKLFEKFDVIIAPSSPVRVPKRGEIREAYEEYNLDKSTVAVNLASLPAISVPCGTDKNNMPVGFQIIGKPFDEEGILKVAYNYEKRGDYIGA
ncbi:MAG: Asp-tRNA(Asn)/Glu-tRNA(Gln) amidotransferase subunit GatA [Clostridia bacterium]